MELPVAKQSYLPTPEAMVRAIKRADVVLARTVAQEEPLDGATAFTNPARQGLGLANFATDLASPAGADPATFIDAIMAWFAAQGAACAWMDCAGMAWAPEVASLLVSRGWRPQVRRVFRMDRLLRPSRLTPDLQIIPSRAAYAQLREFFQLFARHECGAADDRHAAMVADALVDQLDEQRVEHYLARLAGRPVACAGVLGLGQTGVIQPAFTDPAQRGQGIGGTLMAHVLDHCVRSLYDQVLVDRVDGCTAIPFYESLGFKQVAQYVRYLAPM